ncbi:MAG: DUF3473 domain-containing protein [Planctomycetes bacterium]|nr:DUF3473 domain-containing protein [Planctomycetia bacterium]MBI3465701.1 DUF3473 domain-containing protein [Planctomycetota bacterium]
MSVTQLNAFTVDVEDYYHVSGFSKHIDRSAWDSFESRVVASTHRILDLLDRHHVRATFFVLGWVAERHPKLVHDIHQAGHEVGSHSYWHRLVYQMTPDEFRADLRRSKKVLEDIVCQPVTAYRAPSFSITRASLWALDILADEGFCYDSSIFPIRHDRYGIPGAEPGLHQIETRHGPLWELPPTTVRVAGVNVPVAGGGYFRLYPSYCTCRAFSYLNRRGRSVVFYVHPWEIDPDQPRLRVGSRLGRFRHYVNLKTTERKLERLLQRYRFAPLSQLVAEAAAVVQKPNNEVSYANS